MASNYSFSLALLTLLLFLLRSNAETIPTSDVNLVQFALNLEFLEAEFFLFGAFGKGLDSFAPNFTGGGPAPEGGKKAQLDPLVQSVVEELGYEEIGHLKAIFKRVGGFQRPQLNISAENFGEIFDKALGQKLNPPFDPYASSVNFLLASYLLPYVGLTGYVDTIPHLSTFAAKDLVVRLLAVETGQDAIIRTLLYEQATKKLEPYDVTVGELTDKLSQLRNMLGKSGPKDEGVIVSKQLGPEGLTQTNLLSADSNSLAYSRTPEEILRIVYGSGDAHVPGGFHPHGGNGDIAKSFLKKP